MGIHKKSPIKAVTHQKNRGYGGYKVEEKHVSVPFVPSVPVIFRIPTTSTGFFEGLRRDGAGGIYRSFASAKRRLKIVFQIIIQCL